MSDAELERSRKDLNLALLATEAEEIPEEWSKIQPLIAAWWKAYKQWEGQDRFNGAYADCRMTVRSFGKDFKNQVRKTIKKGDLKIPQGRFFADKTRTRLGSELERRHHAAFHESAEHQKYWQNRGIDSAAFAQPANFLSREAKYANGLHDLSASLVNPKKPINLQLFSSGDGVHLAFVPLSKEEDQQLIWKLAGLAKGLHAKFPAFYNLVRGYRAEMTRIKLARNYDIGTGFTVTPTTSPGRGPRYSLKYGLGTTIKEKGRRAPRKIPPEQQAELLKGLREEALHFKRILNGAAVSKKEVNEIVIALRQHAGPFPVYAELKKALGYCECFKIVGDQKMPTGRKISIASGKLT